MGQHSLLTGVNMHVFIAWTWANQAARLAQATASGDIGKAGWQQSDNTTWLCIAAGSGVPVWFALGGNVPKTTPDTPPLNPGSLNDEFTTGTTVDLTRWTWVNQGVASGPISFERLLFTAPSTGASNQLHLLVQPTPATPYTVVTKTVYWGDSRSNFEFGGLVVRDSATGRLVTVRIANNGYAIDYWTDTSTFSTAKFSSATWPFQNLWGFPAYLKWQDDGTNFNFSYSQDGIVYFTATSLPRTQFLAAPNQIGMLSGTNIASGTMIMSFEYFRQTQ